MGEQSAGMACERCFWGGMDVVQRAHHEVLQGGVNQMAKRRLNTFASLCTLTLPIHGYTLKVGGLADRLTIQSDHAARAIFPPTVG